MYLDENEKVSFKDESLIWFQPNIIYGDWYGGPNGDGTYTLETEITATEVVINITIIVVFLTFLIYYV